MTSQQTEEIVKIVLPRVSGSLSILGSSAIILSMLTDRGKKLRSSFNRLLFMMCCLDLFPSFAFVWSSSALPKDNGYFSYGVAGNWTTCRVQGLMFQLGMAVPLYFYFLTIHYLLIIRYGMKEERIRRRIEPLMHLFALTFAIGTAVSGYILKLFNPVGNICWISEYPKDCFKDDSDVDCIYGENLSMFRWIFAGMPSTIPLFLVPFNMGFIFWTVRKQTLKMNRYNPNSLFCASPSTTRSSTAFGSSTISAQSRSNDNFSSEPSSISTARRKMKCKTTERLKAVAHQGLAYTLCYVFVFSWPIIMVLIIMHSKDNKAPLSIAILYNMFYPLQGFLNYIVYIRPFVVQLRKGHPEWSILRAIYMVTFPKGRGRRENSISIFQQLNCCSLFKRDEDKTTEISEVECQPKNGRTNPNQGTGKNCDLSRKELYYEEEAVEDNEQSNLVQGCTDEDREENTFVQALIREASHKSELGLDAEEQEIKQEREYFQAITELSKITGNYS